MKMNLLVAAPLACCVLFTNPTFADVSDLPYIGFDIATTKTALHPDFGGRLFYNKSTPQLNMFLGYHFSEILGFELGYQRAPTRNRAVTINPGDVEFEIRNYAGITTNGYTSQRKSNGFNFNFVPKFYISEMFSVSPILGFSYLKSKLNLTVVTVDGAPATPLDLSDLNVNFSIHKFVPRVGFRGQILFCNNIGIRASYIWENSKRMEPQTLRGINQTSVLKAKFKNTSTFGMGVYYQF